MKDNAQKANNCKSDVLAAVRWYCFWDTTMRRLVANFRRFGGMYCLQLQVRVVERAKASESLPDYTESHSKI
jgi:arabinogalactan endo-1,4-beta-galactosidase